MQKLRIMISIFLPLSLFLFGCTPANTIIKISEIGSYPRPLTEPLPLNIGAYYKDEFKEFETTVSPVGTMKSSDPKYNGSIYGRYGPWHIHLGQSNVALFDYILHNLFKEVRPTHSIPEDIQKTENIVAVIEPSIYAYECEFFTRGLKIECYVKITYAVKFHSPNKKQKASWLIKGEGSVSSGGLKSLETFIREATMVSMRDVAAKFIVDFCRQEDINQIFSDQCNQ